MSKFLIIILVLPLSSYALNLTPGKWSVGQTLNSHGKKMNINGMIQGALAVMPAEEREKIMAQVGNKAGLGKDGIEICYTKDLLKSGKIGQIEEGCSTNILEHTNSVLKLHYTCKNGRKGDGKWKRVDDKTAEGVITMTEADGKMTQIEQKLKFITADCGTLKPL